MKTKIREFERESGLEIFGLGARREKWEAAMEKFAELVIRDCIGNVKGWEKDSRNHISYMLKNHYEVKE